MSETFGDQAKGVITQSGDLPRLVSSQIHPSSLGIEKRNRWCHLEAVLSAKELAEADEARFTGGCSFKGGGLFGEVGAKSGGEVSGGGGGGGGGGDPSEVRGGEMGGGGGARARGEGHPGRYCSPRHGMPCPPPSN